jgi:hypothetical protein
MITRYFRVLLGLGFGELRAAGIHLTGDHSAVIDPNDVGFPVVFLTGEPHIYARQNQDCEQRRLSFASRRMTSKTEDWRSDAVSMFCWTPSASQPLSDNWVVCRGLDEQSVDRFRQARGADFRAYWLCEYTLIWTASARQMP